MPVDQILLATMFALLATAGIATVVIRYRSPTATVERALVARIRKLESQSRKYKRTP